MATRAICEQSGYITPAVSGVPGAQRGDHKQKRLPTPHVSKMATSPVPSWGPQCSARNQKSEMTTWPTRRKNGHITPAVSGVPKAQRRAKKTEMATWPIFGQSGYITLAVSGVPILSGGTMATWHGCGQSGYITLAVLGVAKAQRGDKIERWPPAPDVGKLATSPLPSQRSPMLSSGSKNKNGYLPHIWAKWLHQPCRLWGLQISLVGQEP